MLIGNSVRSSEFSKLSEINNASIAYSLLKMHCMYDSDNAFTNLKNYKKSYF